MGISFNPWRIFTGSPIPIQSNNKYSNYENISFQDSFQKTSVDKFYDEKQIKTLIANNPKIKEILDKNNMPVSLNIEELMDLKQNHCKDTAEICGKIYKVLPPALKDKINIKDLKDGAMLHDFGKVLIPPEILNKKGRLTEDEHRIMNLHSELGYQLLKNTDINNEVLSLIKYHHNNIDNNKNFIPDINLQVLNLADKYSALTEKRVYKNALTPQQALSIIYKEVKKGEVHPFLFKALVTAVNSSSEIAHQKIAS